MFTNCILRYVVWALYYKTFFFGSSAKFGGCPPNLADDPPNLQCHYYKTFWGGFPPKLADDSPNLADDPPNLAANGS